MSLREPGKPRKMTMWAFALIVAGGCGGLGENDGGTGGDTNLDGFGGNGGANAPSGGGNGGVESMGGGGTGGGPVFVDGSGGVLNNPVEALVADPGRSTWNALTITDGASADEYASTAHACFATPDACEGSGCGVFATCCVDNGTCCKQPEFAALPDAIDFPSCAGTDLTTCLAPTSTSVFGPETLEITGRGLIPSGNASEEGGALVGEPVDLAGTRVRLDVEFALPIGCGVSCLESAGVAFTSETPDAFVDAGLGLLLSGSRREVNLMIGNAVARSFDAGNDATRWSLVATPDGRVEVLRDDAVQFATSFDPHALRHARLALFGRNLSEGANRAAIRRVEFSSAFCDAPSAWITRDPISVSDTVGPVHGAGPSISFGDGELRVAYDLDGDIYWGSALSVGVVELLSPAPALSPVFPHEVLGVSDPDMVFDGSEWHLFYTARDADGNRSVGHAVAGTSDVVFTADAMPTLTGGPGVRSLDAPTVYMRDGLWVLIVRATLNDGATELQAYYTSAIGTSWARIVDGELEARTRVEGAGTEITGPSLIVHNSGYQLYYGRRTGTRWAVDVLASDELLLWRAIGEALGPIEDDERFDARGGRAPDAISLTDRVELVYRGHDGVSFELGWAVRDAPSDTAPAF